jgi:hypothetical protein
MRVGCWKPLGEVASGVLEVLEELGDLGLALEFISEMMASLAVP